MNELICFKEKRDAKDWNITNLGENLWWLSRYHKENIFALKSCNVKRSIQKWNVFVVYFKKMS